MSFWHPSKETREVIKLWVDCAQLLTILATIGGIALTFYLSQDTRARELRKPYEEKQLNLYLEAAKIAARMGKDVGDNRPIDQTVKDRFWELYWGELPFVESPEVRALMENICRVHFPPLTKDQPCGFPEKKSTDDRIRAAMDLALCASKQIKARWVAGKPNDQC
jgi:hypothetical protein